MVMKTKDIPDGTEETPAMRLREAREGLGLSRAELARLTGIPAKSIEKFEYGSQEPSLSRAQTLAEALGVTTQWIMGEEEANNRQNQEVPKEQINALSLAQPVSSANENNPMQHVRDMLERLDDMRADEFQGVQRQALALTDDIRAALKYFEPTELLVLADERGLHKGGCHTENAILGFFGDDPEKAQAYCGSIEERIMDTAILGADLYAIDRNILIDRAEELEVDAPGFWGWGDYEDFVPVMRPVYWMEAIKGVEVVVRPHE